MSDWKTVKVPHGAKLFKAHTFNFLFNGSNYLVEVDEYTDGSFTAHGEHSTDKNFVFEPCSGKDLASALSALVQKISARG